MSDTAPSTKKKLNSESFWSVRIIGVNVPVYLVLLSAALLALFMEVVPSNIVSGLALTVILGGGLKWLGDQIPGVSGFGGGPLLCILVPALLLYLGVFPQSFASLADAFYNDYGFAELAVTGLIVGSILGMDRNLLVKIGVRFFVPLLSGLVLAFGFGALAGYLTGFGVEESLFYVVAPVMGGGMAAGAVPMAEIYAQASGTDSAGHYLALLTPAVMIANVFCIILAGVLNGLGKRQRFRKHTGDGQMLRSAPHSTGSGQDAKPALTAQTLLTGMTISIGIYIFGELMYGLVPQLHAYVWIILAAAVLRVANLLPAFVSHGAEDWYTFISKAWIPAVLVAISAGMIELESVIGIVTSPDYLALTLLSVLVATAAAGFVGVLVGFYFIESAISGGLGMADMGGSGDVAVLSACNRLELMPFLQIASRIGGATTLVVVSLLATFLM